MFFRFYFTVLSIMRDSISVVTVWYLGICLLHLICIFPDYLCEKFQFNGVNKATFHPTVLQLQASLVLLLLSLLSKSSFYGLAVLKPSWEDVEGCVFTVGRVLTYKKFAFDKNIPVITFVYK